MLLPGGKSVSRNLRGFVQNDAGAPACRRVWLLYFSAFFLLCRQQRLAEWKATQLRNKFGEVLEISGKDYVQEVTKAGEGLWVVLHLYKQG